MRIVSRGLVVLALFATAACDATVTNDPAGAAPQSAAAAAAQLRTIPVGSWHSMAGYARERFPHWSSQGDGCDTRDVVLKRQGTGVRTGSECHIVSGRWVSRYDGKTVTDPDGLDIDHMVPLANAWRTGAYAWTDDRREQFANDLVRPQLLAVTATTNRSKGDQDPSQWRPPARNYWCEYAKDWIAVKAYWKLIVTADEKTALEQMLETC